MKVTKSTDTWRVFVAIELPAAIREKLMVHARHLREVAPHAQASWSRPENIHLTLRFLGDLPKSRIDQLSEAATHTTKTCRAFSIRVAGTGAFPTRGAPRVLWIGLIDLEGKLSQLQTRLEAECARLGFEKEERTFNPHLTIARLRKPEHARVLAAAHKEIQFKPEEFKVSEVLVIRSELSSAGSKYTTLSKHPLEVE